MAWIFVLGPPRERPIAWQPPSGFCPGGVLVGAGDGTVDHVDPAVAAAGEAIERPLPHARAGPAVEAGLDGQP